MPSKAKPLAEELWVPAAHTVLSRLADHPHRLKGHLELSCELKRMVLRQVFEDPRGVRRVMDAARTSWFSVFLDATQAKFTTASPAILKELASAIVDSPNVSVALQAADKLSRFAQGYCEHEQLLILLACVEVQARKTGADFTKSLKELAWSLLYYVAQHVGWKSPPSSSATMEYLPPPDPVRNLDSVASNRAASSLSRHSQTSNQGALHSSGTSGKAGPASTPGDTVGVAHKRRPDETATNPNPGAQDYLGERLPKRSRPSHSKHTNPTLKLSSAGSVGSASSSHRDTPLASTSHEMILLSTSAQHTPASLAETSTKSVTGSPLFFADPDSDSYSDDTFPLFPLIIVNTKKAAQQLTRKKLNRKSGNATKPDDVVVIPLREDLSHGPPIDSGGTLDTNPSTGSSSTLPPPLPSTDDLVSKHHQCVSRCVPGQGSSNPDTSGPLSATSTISTGTGLQAEAIMNTLVKLVVEQGLKMDDECRQRLRRDLKAGYEQLG